VLLAVFLGWGLLRLRRAWSLRAPVVVDDAAVPAVVVVPTSRLARLYRPARVPRAEVLGVELAPHASLLRGERRWRLAVTTTSGQLLSDAITAPYHRDGRPPAPSAVAAVDGLRAALRGSALPIT
jgi:hypothetical protein